MSEKTEDEKKKCATYRELLKRWGPLFAVPGMAETPVICDPDNTKEKKVE